MIALLLTQLEQVFGWLLSASWQAAVLAMVVLLLQGVLRGRLNPRWRYALWLLVIIRLLLPLEPESALSLFQFAPQPPPSLVAPVTEPLFVQSPAMPDVHVEVPLLTLPSHPFSLFSLLAIIWLIGVIVLFLLTWQVNRRFMRQVAASPEVDDAGLLQSFAEAKAELGIRRSIRLIENAHLQSPAIMGLFHPTLLLPAHVREKFDATELRLIFLHELAHLKRGDILVQGLIALLQILHWFNPVLWFAFRRMRADREPATDALVLSRAGEAEKERYGLMLIKLLEHFNQRHSLPTLVGILEDKDQFKRRFSLIAKFTRGAYGWSLLGAWLIAILGIAGLTKKLPAATTADDPQIDISSTIIEFKIDPKTTQQSEEFQAVLRSPTEKGLNEALQKCTGFLLLGIGPDIQFHLSALTPPKEPNAHKTFRSSTELRLGEDPVDSKIDLHWIDSEHIQINCQLELRDAKNVSSGPVSATWIQPIGKDGVLLLAKNGLTIVAPQSDGSQIGCILRFVARANPKVGVSVLAASDQMKDVELLPSGANADSAILSYFNQALKRDQTLISSNTNSKPKETTTPPASQPASTLPAKSKAMIKIGLKVVEVSDGEYLKNKKEMDAAVERADMGYFNNRKGISMLSSPSVTTELGQKDQISIVRKSHYLTSFENARTVSTSAGQTQIAPPTPTEIATKEVGINAEFTPSIDDGNSPTHGKILLAGKLSLTSFDGLTPSNVVAYTPSFTTHESLFLEALEDNQLKGIWIPGGEFEEQSVTGISSGNPATPQNIGKKRLLVFFSAARVK